MTNQITSPTHCPGYILHTVCPETKKVLFFTDAWSAVSNKQTDAFLLPTCVEALTTASFLQAELGKQVNASVNGDYLYGDKVRIKLSRHHHLVKSFSTDSNMQEKLTAYNEGIVESTRWSNVDGKWLVLAEITITIKTPGRGKNMKLRRVTCTQAVDMEHLLTAATIVSVKTDRKHFNSRNTRTRSNKNTNEILKGSKKV